MINKGAAEQVNSSHRGHEDPCVVTVAVADGGDGRVKYDGGIVVDMVNYLV